MITESLKNYLNLDINYIATEQQVDLARTMFKVFQKYGLCIERSSRTKFINEFVRYENDISLNRNKWLDTQNKNKMDLSIDKSLSRDEFKKLDSLKLTIRLEGQKSNISIQAPDSKEFQFSISTHNVSVEEYFKFIVDKFRIISTFDNNKWHKSPKEYIDFFNKKLDIQEQSIPFVEELKSIADKYHMSITHTIWNKNLFNIEINPMIIKDLGLNSSTAEELSFLTGIELSQFLTADQISNLKLLLKAIVVKSTREEKKIIYGEINEYKFMLHMGDYAGHKEIYYLSDLYKLVDEFLHKTIKIKLKTLNQMKKYLIKELLR